MIVRFPRPIDWSLYLGAIALQIFGIAVIASLGSTSRTELAVNQAIFTIIGVLLMIVLTLLDYRTFKAIAYYLYIVGVIGLLIVLAVGSKVFGATRWIDLGLFQFQPSELFKPILAMGLAKLLTEWPRDIKTALVAAVATIIPVLLVTRQPDLGTASILLVGAVVMVALKGLPRRIWLIAGVALILVVPLLFASLKPYQRERLKSFTNPSADPLGSGYNVQQSLIAVGSGGLFGRGLGQGSQSQLQFLPVAHTDFIFAGVAEATGFIGSGLVLILLTVLISRTFNVARVAQDEFGYYFAFGMAFMILIQSTINIGVNLGLLPATGVPLPFVSYGGTQTITALAVVGILQSIYARHKKIRFA
ncbi:MAG: rod shape-determining protein RodA [Patescibacteria group bacterium]